MDETNKTVKTFEPILTKESKEYKDKLDFLIGRHNLLCRIESAFKNNEKANSCFNEAVEDVLANGSQSIANMYARAIEIMSEKLSDCEDDVNTDVNAMRDEIKKLRNANRILSTKLDMISQLVEKQKMMETDNE